MRKTWMLLAALVVVGSASVRADEPPKFTPPQKEHEWLKQLEGQWETDGEMVMEPGKPSMKFKGTESVRLLGGFWMMSEMKSDDKVIGMMTVGYDAQKKKYVGTWVCSMSDWLCQYEGKVEGKVLTLNCEGPNPTKPGTTCKMRDVIEIKDKDTRVLISSIQMEDGKWVKFMTMTSRRKK